MKRTRWTALSLAFLPMWRDYVHAALLVNNLWVMAEPLIAWLGRSRPATPSIGDVPNGVGLELTPEESQAVGHRVR